MAYTKTQWADGVTPVNAANLNKIETELEALDAGIGTVPARLADPATLNVANFDTFQTTGWGYFAPGATGSPSPAGYGYVQVLSWPGVLSTTQIAYAHGSDAAWERHGVPGSWGAWSMFLGYKRDFPASDSLAAPDTTLYRSAGYTLRVSEVLEVNQSVIIGMSTNAFLTLRQNNGTIWFGASPDTNLYRSAANVLQTDDSLYSKLDIAANLGAANQIALGSDGKVYFGLAADTNLYRLSADNLKTDDSLWALQLVATGAAYVDYSNAGARLNFGSAADTNLYRSAANMLKTDGNLLAGLEVYARQGSAYAVTIGAVGTGSASGIGFGNPIDASLYRSAAGQLKTDGYLFAGSSLYAWYGAAPQVVVGSSNGLSSGTPTILFGSAGDTSLFRSGANTLRTPGHLYLGQNLVVEGGIAYIGSALDCYLSRDGGLAPSGRLSSGLPVAFTGYSVRNGLSGAWHSGSCFNVDWTGSSQMWIDDTNIGTIQTVSDLRYKKNIRELKSSWEAVKKLRPITYRWRNKDIFVDDGKDHVGFVAQEVQPLIPSGVYQSTTPDNKVDEAQPMSLMMTDIVATLTKALQEAMTRIETLEASSAS